MKIPVILIILTLSVSLFAQTPKAEDFGFRHFTMVYNGDTVDILLKSKTGDELKPKPLFFFCQGSLPIPLIITEGTRHYSTFPFAVDSLIENYHLVIVSKPFIPLIVESNKLGPDLTYRDTNAGGILNEYSKRNLLEYYVDRNLKVIEFLFQQKFVSTTKLVVAGHSQGAAIAAKMATVSQKISYLIYSGGNPFGQIMSLINQSRQRESDSTQLAENGFKYWESVVADKENMDDSQGDTYKSVYGFTIPPIQYLLTLKIPVYVCYGTFDGSAPFNDYLRIETIRSGKNNFSYKAYIGRDHNFFGTKPTGEIDYDNFGWDIVASDWMKWLALK